MQTKGAAISFRLPLQYDRKFRDRAASHEMTPSAFASAFTLRWLLELEAQEATDPPQ